MEALAYLYSADAGHTRTGRDDAPIDRLAATLKTWAERRRQRRELAQIDAVLLADMGISPGQARYEADKPFWKT